MARRNLVLLFNLENRLCDRFGEGRAAQVFDHDMNEISSLLRVLINGRHYTTLPAQSNTRLEDGDEVALFPPVAGG